MIPFFGPYLAAKFGAGTAKAVSWGIISFTVVFALWRAYSAVYDRGVMHERAAWETKVERIVKARSDAAARAAINDARTVTKTDTKISNDRKEFDNATAHIPDRPLSDRQRARLDRELRSKAQR